MYLFGQYSKLLSFPSHFKSEKKIGPLLSVKKVLEVVVAPARKANKIVSYYEDGLYKIFAFLLSKAHLDV